MTSNHRAVRLAASTALVAGTAILTAAPSYAGPPPEDPTPTARPRRRARRSSKAQIEHDEPIAGSPGMAAQVKAKIEAMERASRPAAGLQPAHGQLRLVGPVIGAGHACWRCSAAGWSPARPATPCTGSGTTVRSGRRPPDPGWGAAGCRA